MTDKEWEHFLNMSNPRPAVPTKLPKLDWLGELALSLWSSRYKFYERIGQKWTEPEQFWNDGKKEYETRDVPYELPVVDFAQIHAGFMLEGLDPALWATLVDLFEQMFLASKRTWTTEDVAVLEAGVQE